MNKKYILLIAVVLLVIVTALSFTLTSCSSNSYLTALPQDAKALVKLDINELIEDADLTLEEKLQLAKRFYSSSDDLKTGIDLSSPLYGFISGEGTLGFVAAVDDEDDLKAFAQSLQTSGKASELTHQRGYSWQVILNRWLLVFDGKKALVMGPAVGADQDQLRNQMATLMSQGKKESGMNSELFADLQKSDKVVAAVANSDCLPEAYASMLTKWLGVTHLNDVRVGLALDSDDNELQLHLSLLSQNPDITARIQEVNQFLRPIDGDMIPFSHASTAVWATANVEGQQLIEYLRKNPSIRTALIALNTAVDVDLMIKAIDGDVAIDFGRDALTFFLGWDNKPNFMLTADLDNADFLHQSDYWLQSARQTTAYDLQAVSDHDFRFQNPLLTLYFGVHDKKLYVNTSAQMGTTADEREPNAWLTSERSDIKGKRFFATVDVEELLGNLRSFIDEVPLAEDCKRLTLETEDVSEWELKVAIPEGVNIVKILILDL